MTKQGVLEKLLGPDLRVDANVKRVRPPRLQGLDQGEAGFRDFPFRLKKSLK